MAQFGGQKNPPWATQFTATAVSQPGQLFHFFLNNLYFTDVLIFRFTG